MDTNESKYYVINVFGKKPQKVQVGTISKTSGQPNPGAVDATQELGEVAIPNYSTAWGKLALDKDKKLTGEITFLPWGHSEGRVIEIRFLRNCASISLEFQKEKKLVMQDDQAEIVLKIGQNRFKQNEEREKILMLKHHGLNRSNGSRNPENRMTRFETYKMEENQAVKVSDIEIRQEAEKIVLAAKLKPERLEVLAKLFDVDHEQSDEVLFDTLINRSQNFRNFFQILKNYEDQYKAVLTGALDCELIYLNSEDAQIVIGGAKDILMSEVEGSNVDERMQYILDNLTEPMYYHALNRVAGELERFKTQVLQ